MGASCCENKSSELMQLKKKQAHVLRVVMAINLVMFVLEFSAGLWSRSTALMGDSLDMLGDAVVYGFSLYVLHKSERARALAAFLKGGLIVAFGLWVLYAAVGRMLTGAPPVAEAMGAIGLLALAANLACLLLLIRHKDDDLNMKSTWICSRNDIVSNTGVLLAAALVALTRSKWPDILMGLLVSLLFLKSALPILVESVRAMKRGEKEARNKPAP
jgi:cation diffusion facilitator family transporter